MRRYRLENTIAFRLGPRILSLERDKQTDEQLVAIDR